MGVDLMAQHGGFSVNWLTWKALMELGWCFGWLPEGTVWGKGGHLVRDRPARRFEGLFQQRPPSRDRDGCCSVSWRLATRARGPRQPHCCCQGDIPPKDTEPYRHIYSDLAPGARRTLLGAPISTRLGCLPQSSKTSSRSARKESSKFGDGSGIASLSALTRASRGAKNSRQYPLGAEFIGGARVLAIAGEPISSSSAAAACRAAPGRPRLGAASRRAA